MGVSPGWAWLAYGAKRSCEKVGMMDEEGSGIQEVGTGEKMGKAGRSKSEGEAGFLA